MLRGTGAVHSVEPVEDSREMFGGDALARVDYFEVGCLAGARQGHRHSTTVARILDGVIDEIAGQLSQPATVTLNPDFLALIEDQPNTALLGHGSVQIDGVFNRQVQPHPLRPEVQVTGVRMGSGAHPRTSSLFFTIVEAEKIDPLKKALCAYCDACERHMRMVQWAVEEVA